MGGRGRGRGRGRKSNTIGRSSEIEHMSFDNYEDPLDLDENVQVKNEVFVDEIAPECHALFGMMSSQDLLDDQRRMLQATGAIDERNIMERLGCLERKVDFLLNLNTKILARVDKLCENAKEVVEPTEFPIKSKEELEAMDEKIANTPDKYIDLFKILMKPLGFEKHICRIFDEGLVTEMNFDGVSSKLGLTNYANLNSALYESLKKDGYTYTDYRSTVRAAFHKTKNRIYKSISKKRREGKSMPTTEKIYQRDESPTGDEEEEEGYQTRINKSVPKKRSMEKSTPTPAKRVMLRKEDSPLDDEDVDRFPDSSSVDFVKDDPDYVVDDEPDELNDEMSSDLEELSLDFPLKDKDDLEAVEKKISSNRSKYVELFKFYLKSGNFEQTIGTFFDESLSCDMSYDGYGSKKAFSNYVHFNIALFESQKSDQFTYEDYKKGVRNAFLKSSKRPRKRTDRKK